MKWGYFKGMHADRSVSSACTHGRVAGHKGSTEAHCRPRQYSLRSYQKSCGCQASAPVESNIEPPGAGYNPHVLGPLGCSRRVPPPNG